MAVSYCDAASTPPTAGVRPPPTPDGYGQGMNTLKTLVLIAAVSAAGVLSACSPTPGSSAALPSIALPSIDPSAAAGAVGTALDQLDAEIDANQTDTGLTIEDRDSLKAATASIRAAVETGDVAAAQPAVDQLTTKIAELDAKLGTDAGTRLKAAIAQLEALLAAS